MLRHRENIVEDGQVRRVHLARQIAPVDPAHRRLKRPPPEIVKLAEKFLRPLNDNESKQEATQTFSAFADGLFFPQLKQRVRQSTYRGYVARWQSQLKPRCGDQRLRDFRVLSA